ncbi:MAG: ABC transporter ATP-binding protein [Chlorobiaceae bacterium]|nr:ABC transporter ATP-binding protein [Chlorobiaceae bacterium]
MKSTSWLKARNLSRSYRRGSSEVRALDDVSVSVERGEYISIVGSSGSGKTTLLNLLSGLDSPTSGTVEFQGTALQLMTKRELALYRAKKVGMVFQSFNLIPQFTALQNVEIALYFNGTNAKERRRQSQAILEQLGLSDRVTHKPADLSGGEQQRVALARAIVKKPEILFADEPTGNLDYENAQQIASLINNLNKENYTIILVTHNIELAKKNSNRIIKMQYGKIAEGDGAKGEGSMQI